MHKMAPQIVSVVLPTKSKLSEGHASLINAKANLLKEQRLASKAENLRRVGEEAAKLPRTHAALQTLGAGKEFGTT